MTILYENIRLNQLYVLGNWVENRFKWVWTGYIFIFKYIDYSRFVGMVDWFHLNNEYVGTYTYVHVSYVHA